MVCCLDSKFLITCSSCLCITSNIFSLKFTQNLPSTCLLATQTLTKRMIFAQSKRWSSAILVIERWAPVYRQSDRSWLFKSSPGGGCHYYLPGLRSPSQRTSPSFDQYRVILLDDKDTEVWITCPKLLRSFVLVGIEPTTYWSPVLRLTAMSTRHLKMTTV